MSGRSVWFLAASQGFQALSTAVFTVSVALVAGKTSDFLGLGLILAARTLPTVVVALVGGVAADRWRKKTVAVATLLGTAVVSLLIAAVIPVTGLTGYIHVLALVAGLISAFGAPSLYSLLPAIVAKENNFRANALVRTWRNGGMLAGPVVAGLFAAQWGAASGVAVSAVCAGVGALFIAMLPVTEQARPVRSIRGDLAEAVGFARHTRWFTVMIGFWAVYLALQGGAGGVVQPVVVAQISGDRVWSWMAACLAAGYIAGSVGATRWQMSRHLVTGSVVWVGLSCVPLVAVALTDVVPVWLVASFIAGVGLEVSGVAWGSALQTRVDSDNIGKVSSLDYAVSFGFVPVGYAVFGVVGSVADGRVVLAVSGVVMAVFAVTAGLVSWTQRFDPLPDAPTSDTAAPVG